MNGFQLNVNRFYRYVANVQMGEERQGATHRAGAQFDKIITENTDEKGGLGGGMTFREKENQGKEQPAVRSKH